VAAGSRLSQHTAARSELARLLRFAAVGGLATLVHVTVAMAARAGLALPELGANLAGFGAAVLVSYTGHARCTFAIDARHREHLPRFLLTALAGLASSSLTVWIVTERAGGSFVLAMALVAVIVPSSTFLAMRHWVFTTARHGLRERWIVLLALGAVAAGLLAAG